MCDTLAFTVGEYISFIELVEVFVHLATTAIIHSVFLDLECLGPTLHRVAVG